MRRHFVWLAFAALLAGCDAPTEPAQLGSTLDPDGALVSAGHGAVEGTAAGAGIRYAGANGEIQVLTNFAVQKFADGTAAGFFHYRAGATEITVDVTCMTIVDGHKAWIAGIISESSIPTLVGLISYFYTFDNGEGAKSAPDIVSRLRVENTPGEDQRFCDELPTILPPNDVLDGNVNVRG